MTLYCRLCAELKTIDELTTTINDTKLKIDEKLIACCQWNKYQNTNCNFPNGICNLCCEKLEKCWLFNETVANAQEKLAEIFGDNELTEIKYEENTEDDELGAIDTSVDIFVEPLKLSTAINEDEKPSIDTPNDTIEVKKSLSHECDICAKGFTTAYNLTVTHYIFLRSLVGICAFTNWLALFLSLNRYIKEFIRTSVPTNAKNARNILKVHRI